MTANELKGAAIRAGLDIGDPRVNYTLWAVEAALRIEESAMVIARGLERISAHTEAIEKGTATLEAAIASAYKAGIDCATAASLKAASQISADLTVEIKRQVRSAQVWSYGLITCIAVVTAATFMAAGYAWAADAFQKENAGALTIAYQCGGGKQFQGADGKIYCQNTWRLR